MPGPMKSGVVRRMLSRNVGHGHGPFSCHPAIKESEGMIHATSAVSVALPKLTALTGPKCAARRAKQHYLWDVCDGGSFNPKVTRANAKPP